MAKTTLKTKILKKFSFLDFIYKNSILLKNNRHSMG